MGMHAKTGKQEYQNINGKNGTSDVVLASKSACLGRYIDCTNKTNLSSTVSTLILLTHPEMCNSNSNLLFYVNVPSRTESGKISFLILYLIRIIKHKELVCHYL